MPHSIKLVSPQRAFVRERVEVVLEIVIGSEGLATGGGVRIYPPITTPPHFWSMVRWAIGLATLENVPAEADLECFLARHDRARYHETNAQLIHINNRGRALKPGEKFRVVLSDCRAQAFPMKQAPFYAEFDSVGEGDRHFVSTDEVEEGRSWREKMARLRQSQPAVMEITGGPPERLVVVLPSKPAADRSFWLALRAEDKYGNATELPAGTIHLVPRQPGLEMPAAIEWPGGLACFRRERFGRVTRTGSYYIDAELADSKVRGTSSVMTTEIQTAVQFGDIHGHTFASDGLGTQEEYFEFARDVAFAELTCLTDHNLFDDRIVELSERFNEPGRFVTLFGREYGDRHGHRNVYGVRAEDVAAVSGPELFAQARGRRVIIVPHHTNASTKNYWGPCDFKVHDEELQRLVEVSQNRGSFETEELSDAVIDGGYGASVQTALAQGLKLGFVGGSDTHRGTPSGPSHPLDPYYHRWNKLSGLTGVLTDELTREGVFAAMWERRTYCTTGPRIVAEYFANDQPMGSIMGKADSVTINGFVGGTAIVEAIELLKNNEVFERLEPKLRTARFRFVDPAPGTACYYVRIRQEDGHYAYLSPVWVGPEVVS